MQGRPCWVEWERVSVLFLKQIVGVALWWPFWVWGLWAVGLSDAASLNMRHPPAASFIPVGHPMVPKCQTSNRLSSLLIPDRLPEVACTPVLHSAALLHRQRRAKSPSSCYKFQSCCVSHGWVDSIWDPGMRWLGAGRGFPEARGLQLAAKPGAPRGHHAATNLDVITRLSA